MEYNNTNNIAILLATYNGEKFLKEQLDSIYSQSYTNWSLYIRDDGSSDRTIDIIGEYSEKYSNIFLVTDEYKHIGATYSFLNMLKVVNSNYYMFSDQDDVWLPNKINDSFAAMKQAELIYKNKPIIVHTDVSLVDKELRLLSQSYWKEIGLNPDKLKTYNYLAQSSYVQGCTMLFNQQVKELSFPVSRHAIMHDWWIATRIINKGVICTLYTPTMLYRQHEQNVFGVDFGKTTTILSKMKNIKKVVYENNKLYKSLKQDGYGSFFKYLYYKILLLIHRRKNLKRYSSYSFLPKNKMN